MIELRYTTCLLVRTFDMSFSDGYDTGEWDRALMDRYVTLKGALPIKLSVRKS